MENVTSCSESSPNDTVCRDTTTRLFYPYPEDMLDPWKNDKFVSIILTHAITFLIGIVGNTIVIVTWAGSRPSRSPTCTFLVSLAVADLLLLALYVPLETLEYFVITWDAGGTICKLSSYVEMLSGMASVLNLVAVSFERFFVIVFPMKARRFCTLNNCRRGLVVVWLLAFVLAGPVLVTTKMHEITYFNNDSSITAYYCWDSDDGLAFAVAVYQLASMFGVPAIFMSVCYACVIRELWSSTKTVTAMTRPYINGRRFSSVYSRKKNPNNCSIAANCCINKQKSSDDTDNEYCCKRDSANHKHRSFVSKKKQGGAPVGATLSVNRKSTSSPSNGICHNSPTSGGGGSHHNGRQGLDVRQARKQVIKMLLFVICLFLICWGPRLIMNVAIKIGLGSFDHSAYSARVAFYLLSFIHSALNPFVYGFMSSNFRRMMVKSCSHDLALALTCGTKGFCAQNKRYESEVREFSTYVSSVRRSKQYGACQTEVKLSRKLIANVSEDITNSTSLPCESEGERIV